MFVTTFYSYKGGVGRTMAMLNVALDLSLKGKNVLVVDFDLEAPGIPTYDTFSCGAGNKGLVEYVSEYSSTLRAPDARDFIYECSVPSESGRLYIMPAGKKDDNYSRLLSDIDWRYLYDEQEGYLLFEDLKQQWAQHSAAFDYVLIDSRTGHTDVGGICTRHLPDCVTVMFLPTMQNIIGLEEIVPLIRADRPSARPFANILFCPSNVPDLDDEFEIIRKNLEIARKLLRYDAEAGIIHHYSSLSLLDQKLFVIDRPKAKLSEEYRTLTKAISRLNTGDHEGALARIAEIAEEVTSGRSLTGTSARGTVNFPTEDFMTQLSEISQQHPRDGEVAFSLAWVYRMLGSLGNEVEALSVAIGVGYKADRARFNRALSLLSQSRLQDALVDLKSVLESENASSIDIATAIELLSSIEPDWLRLVSSAPALDRMGAQEKLSVSRVLASDDEGIAAALDLVETTIFDDDPSTRDAAKIEKSLLLIGLGSFKSAIDWIGLPLDTADETGSMADNFNLSMAVWGESGHPLLKRLAIVAQQAEGTKITDVNLHQCLALSYHLLGETEKANGHLFAARNNLGTGRNFSCWRYRYTDKDEMSSDLDEMAKAFEGGALIPRFLC